MVPLEGLWYPRLPNPKGSGVMTHVTPLYPPLDVYTCKLSPFGSSVCLNECHYRNMRLIVLTKHVSYGANSNDYCWWGCPYICQLAALDLDLRLTDSSTNLPLMTHFFDWLLYNLPD